jgi:hypothetical protein
MRRTFEAKPEALDLIEEASLETFTLLSSYPVPLAMESYYHAAMHVINNGERKRSN